MGLRAEQIANYHRDGFVLVRGVFSRDEMAGFSAAIARAGGGGFWQSPQHQVPELALLWTDPRLMQIAADLVGDPPVYFGESSCSRVNFAPDQLVEGRHLHHDAKACPAHLFQRVNTPLDFTYPVLRMGLYFENYGILSGGLKVTPGSHRIDVGNPDFAAGLTHYNVPTEPGDILGFSLRIMHSPYGMRPKHNRDLALHPREEDEAAAWGTVAFEPMPAVREAMFLDYVSPTHPWADTYIKGRALFPGAVMNGYAAYLVDTNRLDEPAYTKHEVRVDNALFEATFLAHRKLKTDGIAAAEQELRRLPILCRRHKESSPYYVLHEGAVPDNSPETGLRLYNEITPRLKAYHQQLQTFAAEPHMGSLTRQQHLDLRNAGPSR